MPSFALSFCPLLDAFEHPSLHDEVGDLDAQQIVEHYQPARRARAEDHPGGALINRVHHECPPALQYDSPARLEGRYLHPEGMMEKHSLSYLPLLPLRMDASGVLHLAARRVL